MSKPLPKRIKNTFIYIVVIVMKTLLGFLPLRLLGAVGATLGRVGFVLARKERAKTLGHLHVAFGGFRDEDQIKKIASDSWANLGRNGLEMFRWAVWPHEKVAAQVARVTGWEHAEKAVKRGKGVICVTAHLGHWELLAAYVGYRTPIAVVAKPLYDPRLDKLITDFRGKWGGPVIPRGGALKGILRALSENRSIGMLMDQDTGDDGEFVPFFGKPTWAQTGAARIAQKSGAALVPFFMVRGTDGKFELFVEPEIPVGPGPDGVVAATAAYTAIIERYVRAYPEQWVWMHERWKTRPEHKQK
jgi:KDO2-lipid IV(A) lauroyltransferase